MLLALRCQSTVLTTSTHSLHTTHAARLTSTWHSAASIAHSQSPDKQQRGGVRVRVSRRLPQSAGGALARSAAGGHSHAHPQPSKALKNVLQPSTAIPSLRQPSIAPPTPLRTGSGAAGRRDASPWRGTPAAKAATALSEAVVQKEQTMRPAKAAGSRGGGGEGGVRSAMECRLETVLQSWRRGCRPQPRSRREGRQCDVGMHTV